MKQATLFDEQEKRVVEEIRRAHKDADTRYRKSDPLTSRDAADRAVKNLTDKQRSVLRILFAYPNLTDVELKTIYKKSTEPPQSESGLRTRRSELHTAGFVVNTGKKRKVLGHGPCTIWDVAPSFRELLKPHKA